ncbi:uncharacterized protein LOC113238062 [Hyposmocoma kahamanoa]|uniref:uncharacterized protein LOC113238062 n=1 Tax=Hyposmocoma kahamanoa TaxID=1477025 RepID=UPI000E6D8FFA|nr:uncharacterized protein LOC113238062 [Hyposmocoma kahamanoa]
MCSGTQENKLRTPKKKRQPRRVTSKDNFDVDAIRRHVYDYYLRKEIPILKKLVTSLRDSELFRGQKSSLAKVLKDSGFSYKKADKRKILMERHDVAMARCNFLSNAKRIEDWSNVIFTDETWSNAYHTVTKNWTDDTAASTGSVPMGKGERLIICYAGSSKGFVSDALLAFKSQKTVEYHEEMNAEVYEQWFEDMLQLLEEPSIILMDNASYHSRQVDKMPSQINKKQDIIDWLNRHGENVDNSMLILQLLNILKTKKRFSKRYVIDEMASKYGHRVIRIPPYHCQYNAIELIWAQVKGYAARHNTSPPFTANKMMDLLKNACAQVSTENWADVVQKTKNIIITDWERHLAFDNLEDQEFIINVSERSSSDDDDETSSDY